MFIDNSFLINKSIKPYLKKKHFKNNFIFLVFNAIMLEKQVRKLFM